MLLELDSTDQEKVDRLLVFARENNIKLSLVDESDDDYFLPGKPLSPEQLSDIITKSRKSGIIRMEDAHALIYKSFDGR
jgi:hypothetical protein